MSIECCWAAIAALLGGLAVYLQVVSIKSEKKYYKFLIRVHQEAFDAQAKDWQSQSTWRDVTIEPSELEFAMRAVASNLLQIYSDRLKSSFQCQPLGHVKT